MISRRALLQALLITAIVPAAHAQTAALPANVIAAANKLLPKVTNDKPADGNYLLFVLTADCPMAANQLIPQSKKIVDVINTNKTAEPLNIGFLQLQPQAAGPNYLQPNRDKFKTLFGAYSAVRWQEMAYSYRSSAKTLAASSKVYNLTTGDLLLVQVKNGQVTMAGASKISDEKLATTFINFAVIPATKQTDVAKALSTAFGNRHNGSMGCDLN